MSDDKNNKNSGGSVNKCVESISRGKTFGYSLQIDDNDFTLPPVEDLSCDYNTSGENTNNNNDNK